MNISTKNNLMINRIINAVYANEIECLIKEWKEIETKYGVTLILNPARNDEFNVMPKILECNDPSEEVVKNRIFPFLDATGLILTGEDLQVYFCILVDEKDYLFGHDEWAGYMADFMNVISFGNRKWYGGEFWTSENLETVICDYPDFCNKMIKFIEAKDNHRN